MEAEFHETYENTIQKQSNLLRQQKVAIESLQSELVECQSKISVQNRQSNAKIESILSRYKDTVENDYLEEIKIFKRQLEDALKEKDLLASENGQLLRELQITKNGHFSDKNDHRMSQNLHAECSEVIQVLEEETERLRKELMNSEDEKLQILKKDSNEKNKVTSLNTTIRENTEEITSLKGNLDEAQQLIENLQSKLIPQRDEFQMLVAKYDSLQSEKDHLQKILMSVKGKLVEGETKVTQTLRIAEEAIFEKDAALLREKHALEEINRLNSNSQELMKESLQKAKNDIHKVKDDYNDKIKKMCGDVVQLEMEVNGKQLDVERSLLEKQKMEKELENFHKEIEKLKQSKKEEIERNMQRIMELERKNVQMFKAKENDRQILNKLIVDSRRGSEEASRRIFELETKLQSCDLEAAVFKRSIEELKRDKKSLQEKIQKEKEEFSKLESTLLGELKSTCRELNNVKSSYERRLEASLKPHKNLVTQLSSNVEALQKQMKSLQSIGQSQTQDFEIQISELKTKYEDQLRLNENLNRSLRENELKLLTITETNKEYKERFELTENELESWKEKYAKIIRSARMMS